MIGTGLLVGALIGATFAFNNYQDEPLIHLPGYVIRGSIIWGWLGTVAGGVVAIIKMGVNRDLRKKKGGS